MAGTDKHVATHFFKEAPPRNIPFPANANYTAVELLTFLPNSLRSADVVYRFASNKASVNAMISIINTNRMLEKPWQSDYCYKTMKTTMRSAGHSDWAIGKHRELFKKQLQTWDKANLNVNGFRTSVDLSGGFPAGDTLFAHLATGVETFPQGDDALDLTRMVRHCVENPTEGWMYPSDYAKLLQRLGGPTQPSAANMDGENFARWTTAVPRGRGSVPRRRGRPRKNTPQAEDDTPESTPARSLTRYPTPQSEAQAPRRSGRRGRPSLKKREVIEVEGALHAARFRAPQTNGPADNFWDAETNAIEEDDSEYVPGPIGWVKPPQSFGSMSTQALQYAYDHFRPLQDGHSAGPYCPYAFGSDPRTIPPYRPLHLITTANIKSDDLSGWAENLRWAAEQHSTFGEKGWTECPAHMQRIAGIRQDQVWGSPELYLSIQKNVEQEKEDEALVEIMAEEKLASMRYREPRLKVWGDVIEEFVNEQGEVRMRFRSGVRG